jgi:hypothetical protein
MRFSWVGRIYPLWESSKSQERTGYWTFSYVACQRGHIGLEIQAMAAPEVVNCAFTIFWPHTQMNTNNFRSISTVVAFIMQKTYVHIINSFILFEEA